MKKPRRLAILIAVLILCSSAAQASPISATSSALEMSSIIIDKGLTGLSWDGKEFISSYGISDVPLINVSLDGQRVTRFAPSFVGKDEVYAAVSQGDAGFPRGYLYVNSDPSIYRIYPNGSNVQLFSSPPGASRISYVAFDTVGSWGHLLLALDDNGLLWSIKSDGTAKVLDNFSNFGTGAALKPEGIAVAPQTFGAYGGDVLITLEGAGRVLAIPPNDTTKVTTIVQFQGEEPERVLQIPPQSDLYVAEYDTGAMSRVPAANFSNYVGSMLVITEGESEPAGTFNVLQATGNNVTMTRIASVSGNPHFEGASFVPSSASAAEGETATSRGPTAVGATPADLVGGVALLVAVVILAVFFASSRGKRPSR
ncbi:MAG: hypothetical protein OK455_00255 [Thaumarchaeota archaeon]|nr:hypothetical protein [Nitrososphaerota archaeon]